MQCKTAGFDCVDDWGVGGLCVARDVGSAPVRRPCLTLRVVWGGHLVTEIHTTRASLSSVFLVRKSLLFLDPLRGSPHGVGRSVSVSSGYEDEHIIDHIHVLVLLYI